MKVIAGILIGTALGLGAGYLLPCLLISNQDGWGSMLWDVYRLFMVPILGSVGFIAGVICSVEMTDPNLAESLSWPR